MNPIERTRRVLHRKCMTTKGANKWLYCIEEPIFAGLSHPTGNPMPKGLLFSKKKKKNWKRLDMAHAITI